MQRTKLKGWLQSQVESELGDCRKERERNERESRKERERSVGHA